MTVRPCPHCGQPVRDGYARCPFCGTDLETGQRHDSDAERRRKDDVTGGAVLGCSLTALIYLFYGVGWAVSRNMMYIAAKFSPEQRASWMFAATHGIWIGFSLPITLTGLLYLLLRRRFPVFARGLGYSCLVTIAIALGAPFLCSTG